MNDVGWDRAFYESWVVPAGAPSALADIILGAELGPIIDFVLERGGEGGGGLVIKSTFFFLGGGRRGSGCIVSSLS